MTINQAIDTLRKGWKDDGTPYSEAVKTVFKHFDNTVRIVNLKDKEDLIQNTMIAAKELVNIADRLLDGLTGIEARREYPTEDDYWRAVAEEYFKGLELEQKND